MVPGGTGCGQGALSLLQVWGCWGAVEAGAGAEGDAQGCLAAPMAAGQGQLPEATVMGKYGLWPGSSWGWSEGRTSCMPSGWNRELCGTAAPHPFLHSLSLVPLVRAASVCSGCSGSMSLVHKFIGAEADAGCSHCFLQGRAEGTLCQHEPVSGFDIPGFEQGDLIVACLLGLFF